MSQFESINDQMGGNEEARNHRNTSGGSFRTVYWIILIVAIGVAGWSSYSFYQQKMENKRLTDPKYQAEVTKQEVSNLVDQVKKLMILPTNETPTVYIINDAAASMKDQAFYQGSVNGDRVLIYEKAMKAIIYSPSRNIIVNSGPVYVNNQNQQSAAKQTQTATPTTETKPAQ